MTISTPHDMINYCKPVYGVRLLLLLLLLLPMSPLQAQPTVQLVDVIVAPDHSSWLYKTDEKVKFTITVMEHGNAINDVKVRYEIGPEKMEPTILKENVVLPKGSITVDGGTMKNAGFLRCTVEAEVDGKVYRGLATAGFDPQLIEPTVANPPDFNQFWEKAKEELAAVPIDARMTLLPDRCTETVDVYHVNLQNYRVGSRLYGILCMPRKEGKYPAILRVPGAGIRPYYGDVAMAEKGFITLEIGIHGVSVTMEPQVYRDLGVGALNQYYT
jgi:hypothetical protein